MEDRNGNFTVLITLILAIIIGWRGKGISMLFINRAGQMTLFFEAKILFLRLGYSIFFDQFEMNFGWLCKDWFYSESFNIVVALTMTIIQFFIFWKIPDTAFFVWKITYLISSSFVSFFYNILTSINRISNLLESIFTGSKRCVYFRLILAAFVSFSNILRLKCEFLWHLYITDSFLVSIASLNFE